MSFPALLRSMKTSMLVLLLLAVALLGLAMMETRSTTPEQGGVTTPSFELSGHTTADRGPRPKHAHCTDGHGRDGEKNKHCSISQG